MRAARVDAWAKRAGACIGAGLAVTALAGARVAPGSGALGLDLTIGATPTGELGIAANGPAIAATGMRAGGEPASGELRVRNQTGRRLAFRLRALPSSPDVDRALRVRASAAGTVLYEGTLGGLRRWSAGALQLGSGATAAVSLRAWLPPGATGWAGRLVDVPLELRAGGRR